MKLAAVIEVATTKPFDRFQVLPWSEWLRPDLSTYTAMATGSPCLACMSSKLRDPS